MIFLPFKFKHFQNRMHAYAHMDPMRDWSILLILFGIAFTTIIVWNISAFQTVYSGGIIGSPATKKETVIDDDSLNAVRAIFESRAAEEIKYATGVYHFRRPLRNSA
jgi:hypothetical protein